jgi:hypothetical protein
VLQWIMDDIREAARRAEHGIHRAIESFRKRLVSREDDLSGVLKGSLDAELEGTIGALTWECTIVNHGSGRAAEEKEFGADRAFWFKQNDLKEETLWMRQDTESWSGNVRIC